MLKANLVSAENYKGSELQMLNKSLVLIEQTLNSESFKKAIIEFDSFHFKKCFRFKPDQQLPIYTNEQIYAAIMNGARKDTGISFMDFKLNLRAGNSGSTIGYTEGDIITTYRSALNEMTEAEFAAHLSHEWMHTLGFEHSFSEKQDPKRNCYSVPYAIGNIVEIMLTGSNWYKCEY